MSKTPIYIKKILIFILITLFIYLLWWIDILTGNEFNFFIFYFIPVCIAGWYLGYKYSFLISIFCTLSWYFADEASKYSQIFNFYLAWNTLIRLFNFSFIGFSFYKIHSLLESEREKTYKLHKALSDIKTLESFISICCVCKKIRNKDGDWERLESYIETHSGSRFSHGYCKDCLKIARTEAGLDEDEPEGTGT